MNGSAERTVDVEPEAGLGVVEERRVAVAEQPHELTLECGASLGPIQVAYETYGRLSPDRDNAVLVCHALSGDAHAAGIGARTGAPGWWDLYVGPGKALDTDRFFVVSSNVLGGCSGTSGPCSYNPKTMKPWGLSFPAVTIEDMVRVQRLLLDHLGVERLHAVVGGSMGGMQALAWADLYPEMVERVIPIASAARHSAQQIAFNEAGRQAIYNDPDWRSGEYYDEDHGPRNGLSVARIIGHITYRSPLSLERKFGRRLQGRERFGYDFGADFQVESYLEHQGNKFTRRFDANSYLYITKAMDYFDLTRGGTRTLESVFEKTRARFLVLSFTTDWLYTPEQSWEISLALRRAGREVLNAVITSPHGHDSFLLPCEEQESLIRDFLTN